MEELQYPIGKFQYKGPYTEAEKKYFIQEIAETPQKLKEAVNNLTREQIETPYRPGGWTVRQVIHHMADSHMNAFIRYKLALTEENPAIKAYDQDKWANLNDTAEISIEVSIVLLEALHKRWVAILSSLSTEDFLRTFIHPENGNMTLERVLGLYAWHGKHHIAHINSLRKRLEW